MKTRIHIIALVAASLAFGSIPLLAGGVAEAAPIFEPGQRPIPMPPVPHPIPEPRPGPTPPPPPNPN